MQEPAPPANSKTAAKESKFLDQKLQYKEPGFSQAKATNIFRVVNFELFARPNKVVMIAGVLAFSGCVGYIAYMRATAENRKHTYTTMTENGDFVRREKVSRWD